MKKQFFENEKDGFYGMYYENPKGADCAVIGLISVFALVFYQEGHSDNKGYKLR